MNTNIKTVVENFFDNADLTKISKKKSLNATDIIYDNIQLGDRLYYVSGKGFTLESDYKHGYIAKCVMTADQTLYKRPVFMAKRDLVDLEIQHESSIEFDACTMYGWTPRKPYYNFKYYTQRDAASDMDGWGNTEEQFNHQCERLNGDHKSGMKDPTIVALVKKYHKQAYIGSVGEWQLIWNNIKDNRSLFPGFIETPSYFWTSTMHTYDEWYRFAFERTNNSYSYAQPYNLFRVRPLILL